MNRRILHDAALALTRELVSEIGWKTDEDVERGFMTLLPVVEHGLLRYEAARSRMNRLLGKRDDCGDGSNDPF